MTDTRQQMRALLDQRQRQQHRHDERNTHHLNQRTRHVWWGDRRSSKLRSPRRRQG